MFLYILFLSGKSLPGVSLVSFVDTQDIFAHEAILINTPFPSAYFHHLAVCFLCLVSYPCTLCEHTVWVAFQTAWSVNRSFVTFFLSGVFSTSQIGGLAIDEGWTAGVKNEVSSNPLPPSLESHEHISTKAHWTRNAALSNHQGPHCSLADGGLGCFSWDLC